jgi:transcriptional regulator with XRE-family HTH domain
MWEAFLDMRSLNLFDIGKAVRRARRELAMTQQDVATAAGCTKQLILLLEDGRAPTIAMRTVVAAMNAVGLDLRATRLVDRRPTLEEIQAENEAEENEQEAVWGSGLRR